MERTCNTCLDLISQKKTYSTDINMLKRKPPNEYRQMFPLYESEYEPRQNKIDFESAKEHLMKADKKMFEKKRFEMIYNATETMTYTKYEGIAENKEIFIYEFKHIVTDKIDIYSLVGSESDEIFKIDNLINFWSNKFMNEEIQERKFKITGWPFMTLVRRNNFNKVQGICI